MGIVGNVYDEEEYAAMVKDCIERESKLTEWEVRFISSIDDALERNMFLTEKQREKLSVIWERIT